MLLQLAWRNIWRNPRRSLIVLSSVVVGVIAIVLNDGLSIGMISQIFENRIGLFVSHMQIHEQGFNDNKVIQKLVPDAQRVERTLSEHSGVQAFSKRVITYGLLSSALSSSGIVFVGIEPEPESRVSTVKASIVEGEYLTGKKHEIIIGRKLAEKLGVGIGDKVVAMASTRGNTIGSDMFRIVGLFQTVSSEFDKVYAFTSLENAQTMLELGEAVSEFAIITTDRQQVESAKANIAAALGNDYEVLSYADLMPMMIAQLEIYNESIYIVFVIIGLALIFGIINTMLMSVFERIREFGVMMAMGMKYTVLFGMILLEAAIIGAIGAVVGLAAGIGIMIPLSVSGIDLSMFSESLTSFGSGSIIYPVISMTTVVESALVIPLIAVIGALYPAIRAVRLQPVWAIRYV